MLNSFRVYVPGAVTVVSALWDQLKMGEIIDQLLDWDPAQCKLSPAMRLKAVTINILAGRTPLYRVHEFYKHQDLANLFGKGVSEKDLNDDCLARALDKLAQADASTVTSSVLLNAIGQEGIESTHLHSDTTSISVYGKYEEDEDTLDSFIELVHGYSKAHRPDLKQLKVGLAVNQDGIPVVGEPLSGNIDDKTWNSAFINTLAKHFDRVDLQNIIYVADSALVTKGNLQEINQKELSFISRLPANFKLTKELISEAWQINHWSDLGRTTRQKNAAYYKAQSFRRNLDGDDYLFVVVHSSNLDKRKTKRIDKEIATLKDELTKAIKTLTKREFACYADAAKELELFRKDYANEFYPLNTDVVAITRPQKRKGRGRPPKGCQPETETVYQISCTLGAIQESARQKALEQANCFVLMTNLMDKSALEVLTEYKNQTTVETSFKFLKSPVFLDAIYLKKESRIEALTCVLLLALFLHRILQRRVRKALEKEKSYVTVNGIKMERPTGNRILQLLKYVQVAVIKEGDQEYRMLPDVSLEEPLERILRLAGLTPEIYLWTREKPFYLLE